MSTAAIAISDALKTALAEQIPQMFAEEMRGFIETAQKNANALESLRIRLNDRDTEIEQLNETLAKHSSLDSKTAEIAKREKKLADGELELHRKTIENRALVAEEKLKTGIEIMNLALRNVEIRRHSFGDQAVAVPATPAGTQYPGSQGTHAFSTAVPTSSTTTETQT